MIEPVAHRLLENTNIVLIGEELVKDTEGWLAACEYCAERAGTALDQLFDALTECDPIVTEYVMFRAARCPSCSAAITEKTLVAI